MKYKKARQATQRTSRRSIGRWVATVGLCLSATARLVNSVELVEIELMDFGVLAIPRNDIVSTLLLPYSGAGVQISGAMIPIESARRGLYQLSGFPPNTALSFTWGEPATLLPSGTAEPLIVAEFKTPSITTDALGGALLPVGASLKTTGSGSVYSVDAPYAADVTLGIEYWSADDGRYLTVAESVLVAVELRTAIQLVETSSLDFGPVSAKASNTPGEMASLVLGPDGRKTSSDAGTAKIRSIGSASPALVEVIGAAAFYDLTIDVTQPTTVYLSHSTQGLASARFIVEDFMTLPATGGRTDQYGNLEIRVGATLTTEQTEKPYYAGEYRGDYQLTVNY